MLAERKPVSLLESRLTYPNHVKTEDPVIYVGRMQQKVDRNVSEAFEQRLSFDILF